MLSPTDCSDDLKTPTNENIFTKPAQTIGNGIIALWQPPLWHAKEQLDELESKQRELVEHLHAENLAISEVQYSQELQAMFVKMKLYHGKLQGLRKAIKGLHDRSQKLKKRASRLKERQPQEEVIVTKATNIISSK